MVWPFSSGGSNGNSKAELDPTLQEFVKAQGPVSYSTEQSQQSQSQSQPQSQSQSSSFPTQEHTSQSAAAAASSSSEATTTTWTGGRKLPPGDPTLLRAVNPGKENDPPPPTLYPDGRYAHLWKTYRPLARIEQENKSSQEKISDMLLAYNDRDAIVKRIALENCSDERIALETCNQGPPTAHDRFTMCRDYTRKLERCYVTQTRFLRALGYLTDPTRSQDDEDDIQLHADDLYRRMQAQQAMVDEATKEGRPPPVFAPVLASEISRAAGAHPVPVGVQAADGSVRSPTWNDEEDHPDNPALPPEAAVVGDKTRERMRDRLRKLNGADERAIERLAQAQEIRQSRETGKRYTEMTLAHKAERDERRAAGTATLVDRISGLLGW